MVCAAMFMAAALSLQAQAWAGEWQTPVIPAVRAETAPVIDGILSDPCWASAPVITGFTEHRGKDPAKEQTFVRILYDDRYLYAAFECEELEPEKLQAMERKYDRQLWDDDNIEIQLDTFHDHRSRYIFVANTLGTRFDIRSGVFGWNESWDLEWDVACTVGKDRWFAEFAIPIGKLHFCKGKNVTWGVNFHRDEKGCQQESTWAFHDGDCYDAKWFGELQGLDLSNVKACRKPEHQVYVSGTIKEGDELDARTGADVSFRLSPRTVAAVTLNPDYGQVEADADTIELRDTERFLPERRAFFREGAEFFSTPFNVFYSRRIWDIDAGLKLNSMGPVWSVGLVDVEGTITRDGTHRDGNFAIFRATRSVAHNSTVGAIAVNSEREDGYNRVGGLDAEFHLTDNIKMQSQVLGMEDRERVVTVDDNGHETVDHVRKDGCAAMTSLWGGKEPFWAGFDLVDVTSDFRPDLGYVARRDIRGGSLWAEYWRNRPENTIDGYGINGSATLYENHNGETTLRDFRVSGGWDMRCNLDLWFWHNNEFHAPYNNTNAGVWFGYNTSNWWNWKTFNGSYEHGEFEDVPYDQFSLTKPFKVGDRFTSTLWLNYRLEYAPEGKRDVWLARSVSEYTFPNDLRVKLTCETTSQDRHNVTLLCSWLRQRNYDMYLVLTDTRNGETREKGLFTKVVRRF